MAYVGLICEGETDAIALKQFVNAYLAARGETEIRFKALQPNSDASSRPEGGWTRVLGWCRRHAGERLGKIFEIPGFEGDPILTHLLIHVDGDALDLVTGQSPPLSEKDSALTAMEMLPLHLKAALECDADLAKRLIFAIPVQSIEAWILASLVDEDLEFDVIDAKSEYRKRFDVGFRGSKREKFKKAAERAAEYAADRARRSPSYTHFVERELPKIAA